MTETKAKNYFFQICKGLDYMHSKGIFHRDIKPENILFKDNTIKLADFGSCRGIHSRQPYTEYIATRWYRSPECLICDGIYTYKMDLWGAGCVLYEIITKAPLFPGSNELDQLYRIHGVIGTPSQKLLKKMLGAKGITPEYNFAPKQGTGLNALLPNVSAECLELLSSMLLYDPDFRYFSLIRITARDALKHGFFKEYYEAEKSKIPSATSKEGGSSRSSIAVAEVKPSRSNLAVADTKDTGSTRSYAVAYTKDPGVPRSYAVASEAKEATIGSYLKKEPKLKPDAQPRDQKKHHDEASDSHSVVSATSTSNNSIYNKAKQAHDDRFPMNIGIRRKSYHKSFTKQHSGSKVGKMLKSCQLSSPTKNRDCQY